LARHFVAKRAQWESGAHQHTGAGSEAGAKRGQRWRAASQRSFRLAPRQHQRGIIGGRLGIGGFYHLARHRGFLAGRQRAGAGCSRLALRRRGPSGHHIGIELGESIQRHHHAIAADRGAIAGGLSRLGGDAQALDLFGFQGDAALGLRFFSGVFLLRLLLAAAGKYQQQT